MALRGSVATADAARVQGTRVYVVYANASGEYVFSTDQDGEVTQLTVHAEDGPTGGVRRLVLSVAGVQTGVEAELAAGETDGGGAVGVDVATGQVIRLLARGDGGTMLSGRMRIEGTKPTLYRLLPTRPSAGLWRREDGAWNAVVQPYLMTADGWVPVSLYRLDGSWAWVMGERAEISVVHVAGSGGVWEFTPGEGELSEFETGCAPAPSSDMLVASPTDGAIGLGDAEILPGHTSALAGGTGATSAGVAVQITVFNFDGGSFDIGGQVLFTPAGGGAQTLYILDPQAV